MLAIGKIFESGLLAERVGLIPMCSARLINAVGKRAWMEELMDCVERFEIRAVGVGRIVERLSEEVLICRSDV